MFEFYGFQTLSLANTFHEFARKQRFQCRQSTNLEHQNISIPKEWEQEKNGRQDNKSSTTKSRRAIKSSKTNILIDQESQKGSQETAKRPPKAPKRSPRELQNGFKNILKDKKRIFQTSMNV